MLSTTLAVESEPSLKFSNDAKEEGQMLSLRAFSFLPPILILSHFADLSPWPSYRRQASFFFLVSLLHT